MTCRIPTPQSILDDDGSNVFSSIIGTDPYAAVKTAALWARFRYRAIGSVIKTSCDAADHDYWLQCMRDRYAQIKIRYDLKFSAFITWCQRLEDSGLDLYTAVSETTAHTETEDMPDVAGLTS